MMESGVKQVSMSSRQHIFTLVIGVSMSLELGMKVSTVVSRSVDVSSLDNRCDRLV